MNEPYVYKSGVLFLKISRMKGVSIYINGGSDIRNTPETFVEGNETVTVDKWYQID